MAPNLFKQAIEDAKNVRQQALNNAKQALAQAFSGNALSASYTSTWNSGGYVLTASYAPAQTFVSGGYFNSTSQMPTGMEDPNGVIKYTYNNDREEEEILDHIEKEGMVILDESDPDGPDNPHWYEVIKPEKLKKNVDDINSLDVEPPTIEELEEKVDELDQEIMEIEKTHPRSITFKDLAKQLFAACKKEFL